MKNVEILRMTDRVKDGKYLHLDINTSLAQVLEYLSALRNEVQKKDADFSVMKAVCHELVSRLPLPIHMFDNSFILRSRPNYGSEIFTNRSEISYNPFTEGIEQNRFNLPGEQVFYGAAPISSDNANGALTTICESFKELFNEQSSVNEQYLTVGKWNIVKPIPLVMLMFYDIAFSNSIHIRNILPYFADFLVSSCNEEDNRKCKAFFTFFSEAAGKRIDSRNNYLLTTALYHAIKEFYGTDVGILYSSAGTDNHGLNIVVSKEIVDDGYMELNHVVMFKCERDPQKYKSFRVGPCSNGSDVSLDGRFGLKVSRGTLFTPGWEYSK